MMWSIFIWYQDPTPTCDNKGNCTCIDAIGFAQVKHSLYCLLKCWKNCKQLNKCTYLKKFNLISNMTERKWERDYCTFLTWYAGDAQHTWVTDVEAVQQVVGPRHIHDHHLCGGVCARTDPNTTGHLHVHRLLPLLLRSTHTQYHRMNHQHRQCCLPMCSEVCMRVWSITMTLSRESKPKYLV